ncbi:DEAD/DEAH box helicase [Neolewinella aurantiaca]|uniref:DEAD/DEAH box helicase n=1 Tax=Neolewinella aurantiaca TaxID=2602767 RepID=A0A5C7FFA7_9BACT|nr:DUF6364 family protein [Neolewinella aurantiaca]TXF89503.1 DEAD/DEAH box helicase [Neolewinella aurantiaca]
MTAAKPSKKTKAKKSKKKKLTLSIDQEVIEQGKALARDQGISLSKLIEKFLSETAPIVKREPIVIVPDPDVLALMLPRRNGGSYATDPDEATEYYDYVSTNHLNSEEE